MDGIINKFKVKRYGSANNAIPIGPPSVLIISKLAYKKYIFIINMKIAKLLFANLIVIISI